MQKELKWTLLKRPGGVLSAMVTSVEKPPDKFLKNAIEYESRFRKELEAAAPFDRINLIIDSPGGSVASAEGMSAAVLARKCPIRILIDGRCYSAATIVAYGTAAPVCITSGSRIMFHMPRVLGCKKLGGVWTVVYQWTKLATVNYMLSIYRSKSKQLSRPELKKMMETGAYMSADEAIRKGFADRLTTLDAFLRGC